MRAVNLIPADQRGGASVGAGRSEGAVYGVIGLVAGLAVLTLLYGQAHHQVTSRRARTATIVAEAQRAQTAAEQLAPYTSFVALREQREQAVASLVDARFDWAHAFHEFGRVLPTDVSISSLDGTIGSSTGTTVAAPASTSSTTAPTSSTSATATSSSVTSATPPGSVPTFTLDGCATSQSMVAEMLERLRLIDGVQEVTLQSSTASSSSSAGATSGGSGCGGDAPTFAAQITFDPLPSSSAAAAAAKTVADSTGTSSAHGERKTSEGAAR
jgi:Tfp pilus assembly protein PilN